MLHTLSGVQNVGENHAISFFFKFFPSVWNFRSLKNAVNTKSIEQLVPFSVLFTAMLLLYNVSDLIKIYIRYRNGSIDKKSVPESLSERQNSQKIRKNSENYIFRK